MAQWPQFNPKTLKRVEGILRTGKVNYWTGPEGKRFETAFAEYIGCKNAVSVSSGTAALQLALEALGIGDGDEVVCTPYSFRASATCACNVGAKPVFADVGVDHMLNAETIARVLTRHTKAIVVVHLFGQVADLGPILKLARQHDLKVIEDCAQCLGGEYRGRKVGTWGDAGCFSFCQSKHITTGGEGGMVVAKKKSTADLVRSLRDHGWKLGSEPKEFERVGYNMRLTEIQSVIGLGELERLASWNLPRRRRLAEMIIRGLADHPAVKYAPIDTAERKASFWLLPFVLNPAKLGMPVAKFIERLQREGAGVYKVMWPLMADRPVAKSLIGNTIGFWVHPTYFQRDMRFAIAAFRRLAAV